MTWTISPPVENDKAAWQRLYHSYAEFYNVPMNDEILDTVWQWIHDNNEAFYALLAKDQQGNAVGFMHFRAMKSPLRGKDVGFLDDLFINPDCRGSGLLDAMFDTLKRSAVEQDWPFVRWITAENNYRGRGAYDRLANKTQWLTYQLTT